MTDTSSQGFDIMESDKVGDEETSDNLDAVEEYQSTSENNNMFDLSIKKFDGMAGPSEPYVGMEFNSADDAREYYDTYARSYGFTVRVNRKRRSRIDSAVIGFDYVCSKEGFRRKKYIREDRLLRLSKQTRVGCKAILVIAYRRDIEKWVVTNFVRGHNHDLMIPSEIPIRHSEKEPLNEDEKDKKIRELTAKLYNERQRFQRQCLAYEEQCAAYKNQLNKILEDIEAHNDHLTKKVEGVVQSMKEIENEGSDNGKGVTIWGVLIAEKAREVPKSIVALSCVVVVAGEIVKGGAIGLPVVQGIAGKAEAIPDFVKANVHDGIT
ncbi:hypothetical protein Sjap_009388 [Stephania japonica]|uniref:FAR1 domain-containing protein n=1 Tax=Stephania japonica TaxID=461633 RepID=A0AAP0JRW3_9MAGN